MRSTGHSRPPGRRTTLYVAALCLAAGFAAGAVRAAYLDASGVEALSSSLDGYFGTFGVNNASNADMLLISFIKHAKLVAIIWLLAFAPVGGFAAFLLLTLRGAGYGFTTALMAIELGSRGLAACAALCLPQSLLMAFIYVRAAAACVNYAKNNVGDGARGDMGAYAMTLLAGLAAALVAGFIDVYVVPAFVSTF